MEPHIAESPGADAPLRRRDDIGPQLPTPNEIARSKDTSHQVTNMIAVLSSLIRSAPKTHPETQAFADAFEGRLLALGQAFRLAHAQGKRDRVDLADLLIELFGLGYQDQPITVTGPTYNIAPSALTTLTIMLQELVDNARRCGALASPQGTVSVSWQFTADDQVSLTWRERFAGFQASEFSTGFGAKILKMGTMQLRGTSETTLADDGICTILTFAKD